MERLRELPLAERAAFADGLRVGPPDWAGIKTLSAAFSAEQLPMPSVSQERVREWSTSVQAKLDAARRSGNALDMALANAESTTSMYFMLLDLLVENSELIYQWLLKSPTLVGLLIQCGTNLSPEDIEQLTPGKAVKLARLIWKALQDDGFFEELQGFFGGLLGLGRSSETETGPGAASPAS